MLDGRESSVILWQFSVEPKRRKKEEAFLFPAEQFFSLLLPTIRPFFSFFSSIHSIHFISSSIAVCPLPPPCLSPPPPPSTCSGLLRVCMVRWFFSFFSYFCFFFIFAFLFVFVAPTSLFLVYLVLRSKEIEM